MLRQRQEQIQVLARLTDAVVCVVAFVAAYFIRTYTNLFQPVSMPTLAALSWMLAASLAIHVVLYPLLSFYTSLRLKSVRDILIMILKAGIAEFFILGALVFFLQEKTLSRYFFGLFLGLNYALVLAEKLGVRALLSAIRRRGYNYRQVLVVGAGRNASLVIASLRKNKHWGYVPCAALIPRGAGLPTREVEGVLVVGYLDELETVIKERAIDEVFFALDELNTRDIEEAVVLCERIGVAIRLSLSVFNVAHSKVTFNELDGMPVLTFYTTLMTPIQAALKRAMDIAFSLVGLALTALLYPWISYRIRQGSPGPVIFKQVRVGENGRRFKCYKFRTMSADAESRKAELAAGNLMQGPMFKLENDPRVTPFGAFLRKTSLDELPQFFNVLRGDMSLVGTRPPTPDEVSRYQTHYRRRLSIRPGLTGLWQVSGRNRVSDFEEVLKLDLQYIDNWSLGFDLQIIWRTIWIVLFGRGAY